VLEFSNNEAYGAAGRGCSDGTETLELARGTHRVTALRRRRRTNWLSMGLWFAESAVLARQAESPAVYGCQTLQKQSSYAMPTCRVCGLALRSFYQGSEPQNQDVAMDRSLLLGPFPRLHARYRDGPQPSAEAGGAIKRATVRDVFSNR
jgi:hypothetical protein